jgi:hypothetical protein
MREGTRRVSRRDSLNQLGGSKINVFVTMLVHRFARGRLKAPAQADHLIAKDQPEVPFVCIHNAGRSQMAAGLSPGSP